MATSFLFYDLETSGCNPVFDQVIQFAAIRTDLNLNEIERYDWIIRPNPDLIPAPTAMIVHRTPLILWQQGEPEFIVIKRIHELFNTPGTISIGYNTLGFDDEFLRFSFYRNLLAPYTHQYANFCSRADLYPITTLFYLFHPSVIKWPMRNEKISLKLDALNKENGFAEGKAHTAIVDIEATITLAKSFLQYPESWRYALGYFDKTTDSERLQKLPVLWNRKYAVLIEGSLGAASNFCAPVLHLGTHYHYKNQSCWLRLDTETLSHATPHDFIPHCWTMNKKLAEPGFLLPASAKYLNKLTDEKKSLLSTNIAWLENNPHILEYIQHHYCDYTYPKYSPIAPEAALYSQGFWNDEQQRQMQQFHHATFETKSAIIDHMSHPLLKTLAIRALGRFDINLLSEEQREILEEDWTNAKTHPDRVIDYKGNAKLSLAQALEEIQELRNSATLDKEQLQILTQLENWFLGKHTGTSL